MSEEMTGGKNAQIFIYHDLHPEDGAMLQALYSRSPASVVDHLDKVKAAGSGKFMSQFYVGYGHASIGDCGTTTIFIENYSMLAAKAIQDNPMYSGQEASTRYLDFTKQGLHDPYNHPASRAVLDGWMALYNELMPLMKASMAQVWPYDPTQYKSEKIWQGAINARAFDTLRALLPVGCTTLFSWTTNLRQARDAMFRMKWHPLPEMRQLSRDLMTQLKEKYTNSFSGEEMSEGGRYAARDAYWQETAEREHFLSPDDAMLNSQQWEELKAGKVIFDSKNLDVAGLNAREQVVIAKRPDGAPLPRRLQSYGQYRISYLLDFGSFRDIQRHRNGVCQVPMVTARFGIHPWYLSEWKRLLPEQFGKIEATIAKLCAQIEKLNEKGIETSALLNQYLYPMGMQVLSELSYSVPQTLYVGELRSKKMTHPSLRPIAQQMALRLQKDFPSMAIYADFDVDSWSAKRGEQNIEAKPIAKAA